MYIYANIWKIQHIPQMLGVMGQTKNVAVENSNLRKSVTLESSYHYLSGKVACIARN